MLNEDTILETIDIEDKVSAAKRTTIQVATRKFIEESCSLAKMLPPHKKLLFVMHFSHGYSIKEIAELCNVEQNVVTRRIKKIAQELNVMRSCLKETDDGKTNKSTKDRIEAYFRRERIRRNGLRKSKNLDKSI